MLNPLRFQLGNDPMDPFLFKSIPKSSPGRVIWTLQSRMLEIFSRIVKKPIGASINFSSLQHYSADRGAALSDTAVTSKQMDLLFRAVEATQDLSGNIVEIGSYRGVSTISLAREIKKPYML